MTIHKQPRAASDQTMWEAVLGLHAFVERQLAHTLQRRYGVGLSEYRALEALTQAENGECRMQELADHIGLGQSSVTRLVGRLDSRRLRLQGQLRRRQARRLRRHHRRGPQALPGRPRHLRRRPQLGPQHRERRRPARPRGAGAAQRRLTPPRQTAGHVRATGPPAVFCMLGAPFPHPSAL